MLNFLAKSYIVILLLISLLYAGGITIILDEGEGFPAWVIIMYLVGIALTIII